MTRKCADKERGLIQEVEQLKAKRNETSKLIGQYKRDGKDPKEIMDSIGSIGDKIKELDERLVKLDNEIISIMEVLPNFLSDDVPAGLTEDENVEIYKEIDPKNFDFKVKPHWDLGTDLGIIDFERGVKLAGARFTSFVGLGSRLERALINFCLDRQNAKGYKEMKFPYVSNKETMYAAGKLPKFEEDLFNLREKDSYLIPTSEVQVVAFYRDEIIEQELPLRYTSYSENFRSEAGSGGRDTRGIIRLHQFPKVELTMFTSPETSYQELEKLTQDAEDILRELELPYRKIILCAGDTGANSSLTYDLEVWLPSYESYKEISSCSNTTDYQTRRANMRYRNSDGKIEYPHFLNGSGLAIGRLMAAIMENYQNKDGSITIPKPLIPYMGGIELISK